MSLTVELVVTEQCNLHCKYCYMANRNLYMTTEMFDRFMSTMDFFMKRYNQTTYQLTFFGGEPLMNWDLIQYAVPILRADKRCIFHGIVTNGLLLDEQRVGWCKENGVPISFSFDGIWNEKFDEYLAKRELLSKIAPYCKVMIMPKDVDRMVENFSFLVEEYGIPHPDFTPVRDDIWTDEDAEKFDREWTRMTDKNIELFKKGIVCSARLVPTLELIGGMSGQKRKFSCFVGCNGVAFFPSGIYYPCARFGTSHEFPLYDTNTGHIYEDTLAGLAKPEVCDPGTYEKCQTCTIYRFCNSGCSHQQIKRDLSRSEPVENVCKLFHTMYREAMRMFNTLKTDPNYILLLKSRMKNGGGG